jgi:apolipoprotein N-acyltransferase
MSKLWRWACATTGGVVLWLAYPPVNIGWFAIFGVALIIASFFWAQPRAAFALGFFAALVFFAFLLHWLTIVGYDAWILLSLVCAAWFGLMGILISLASRNRWWPLLIPGLWIAQEWMRGSWPFGGFSWGILAFSQVDTPMGKTATVLGMLGSSGWVVLCASLLVFAVQQLWIDQRKRAVIAGFVTCASIALPIAIPIAHSGDTNGGVASAQIGVVQGGTPAIGMNAFDVRRAVLDNHVRETMQLAINIKQKISPAPVFVLWPENSSDLDPFRDQAAAAAIGVAVRAIDVPVLIGAVVNNPQDTNTVFNAGVLWDPITGAGQQYNKTHVVPFGEYIPFRELLAPLVDRFDRISRDFASGTSTGIFNIGDISAGNVICFEVAYNSVTNPLIAQGARLLTVQTNNATYAGTSQPFQQFMIERMRALETGRSVVVAATTGISAFINPDGSVLGQLNQGETGSMVRSVALRGERNLGSYIGSCVVLLWGLGSVVLVFFLTARAVRDRRRGQHKVDS